MQKIGIKVSLIKSYLLRQPSKNDEETKYNEKHSIYSLLLTIGQLELGDDIIIGEETCLCRRFYRRVF